MSVLQYVEGRVGKGPRSTGPSMGLWRGMWTGRGGMAHTPAAFQFG